MSMLVSAAELERLAGDGPCVVVDCRFDFSGSEKGRVAWLAGHVPGAAYAHLDEDLSSPVEDHTGRHPLPESARFAQFLASVGWVPGVPLVAYDEGSGALAGRLWWLMRLHGQSAALLDGGLAAWVASGRPLERGDSRIDSRPVTALAAREGMVADTPTVLRQLESPAMTLLDARAGERFRGETEPLDTRAGHIPGSLNRHFGLNLDSSGRFKSRAELRTEYDELLDGRDPSTVVHSCGSGVTACHNHFAMELAGLEGSRVYAGSWSEWIRDPGRPIATGP